VEKASFTPIGILHEKLTTNGDRALIYKAKLAVHEGCRDENKRISNGRIRVCIHTLNYISDKNRR
jgi:hypothetical protein